ncbi:MAG: hypothetical protein RJA70_3290, partial [Pseudomonadota bacterium]
MDAADRLFVEIAVKLGFVERQEFARHGAAFAARPG